MDRFASLVKREGYVLKHGLRILWEQSKGYPRAAERSESALRSLSMLSDTVSWPTPRDQRHLSQVRSDVLLGLPAGLVLGLLPGSLFLLIAANKWAPGVLPTTFTHARNLEVVHTQLDRWAACPSNEAAALVASELGFSRSDAAPWSLSTTHAVSKLDNRQVLAEVSPAAILALAASLGRTMGQRAADTDIAALQAREKGAAFAGWHGTDLVDSVERAGLWPARAYPAVPTHALQAAVVDAKATPTSGKAVPTSDRADVKTALLHTCDRISDDDRLLRHEMLSRVGLFHPRYDGWFGALDACLPKLWSGARGASPLPHATAFLDLDDGDVADWLKEVVRSGGDVRHADGHVPFDSVWAQEVVTTLRQRIPRPPPGRATPASPSALLRSWLLLSAHVPAALALGVTHVGGGASSQATTVKGE